MAYKTLVIATLSIFLIATSPMYTPPIAIDALGNSLPKKPLYWNMTPSIIICDYAPVDRESVALAIKWWKDIGYNFYGPYTDAYHKQKCFANRPMGYVLITLVDGKSYNHSSLATTNIYSDKNNNEILWSVIMLKQGLVKERVLEHEIGHAIGWMHTNKKGNMMNHRLLNGGWSSEGLANLNDL
jgi:hypothetical protein